MKDKLPGAVQNNFLYYFENKVSSIQLGQFQVSLARKHKLNVHQPQSSNSIYIYNYAQRS